MCTCMGTKTISIMNDVHKLLLLNRIGDESFSEIIRRKLSDSKNVNILQFAGILDNEKGEKIKKEIIKFKDKSNLELKKRIENLR